MAAGGDDNIPETSLGAARGWSGLHDDILGMVLERLDSPLDQARFAAACVSWRALVSTRPPCRVHPWLVLDPHDGNETKRVYCPGAAAVLPLVTHLHETPHGGCFVGCHAGGWVAYEAPLRVMNVFSGAKVPLPEDQRRRFVTRKVIFSESPTSSGCILAVITHEHKVVICVLGSLHAGWMARRFYGLQVADIAFCNGHLYCIMENSKEVAKCEVFLDEYGALVVRKVQWLVIRNQRAMDTLYSWVKGDPDAHTTYIVELHGKLLMAVRRNWIIWPQSTNIRGPFFLVFELVDSETNWKNVTSLGDHALFLGPTCSKAMLVSTGDDVGPRRNHIYYSHRVCYKHKNRIPDSAKEFSTISNKEGVRVCYKEDESVDDSVEEITSVGYYVCGDGHPPMWLFPPDV